MKKIIGLIIGVAAVGSVVWASVGSQDDPKQITYDVTAYTVGQKTTEDIHIYGARVKSVDEAVVSAQISGAVRQLSVKEGESVRKGQMIAQIDAGEYAAQYAQSQAALAIAEEQEKMARRHWEDLKPEERVQYTLESERMRSVVAEKSAYIKRSYVLAPFDGVVSSKFVSDGTTVAPGMPIVRVIGDMKKKEVVFDVPIDVGQGVSVDTTIDIVHGNDTEEAVVYAIDPVADEQTRKITIRAYLSEQSHISVGTFVDVHIAVSMDDGGYTLPYAAVVRQYDDTFVYTVVDDVVHMRKIDVVATMRDHAVVRGVEGNEVIVVHNAHAITDGDRVHIVTGDK